MVDTGQLEQFLNDKSAKDGDIVEILAGAVIEENKVTKKPMLNVPVLLNGRQLIWTPGKIARGKVETKCGTDTDKWVGKKFQVSFKEMIIKGETKNVIIPKFID